jgi:hypothetical protein
LSRNASYLTPPTLGPTTPNPPNPPPGKAPLGPQAMTTLLSLPDDILLFLFEFVNKFEDAIAIRCTCKRLRDLYCEANIEIDRILTDRPNKNPYSANTVSLSPSWPVTIPSGFVINVNHVKLSLRCQKAHVNVLNKLSLIENLTIEKSSKSGSVLSYQGRFMSKVLFLELKDIHKEIVVDKDLVLPNILTLTLTRLKRVTFGQWYGHNLESLFIIDCQCPMTIRYLPPKLRELEIQNSVVRFRMSSGPHDTLRQIPKTLSRIHISETYWNPVWTRLFRNIQIVSIENCIMEPDCLSNVLGQSRVELSLDNIINDDIVVTRVECKNLIVSNISAYYEQSPAVTKLQLNYGTILAVCTFPNLTSLSMFKVNLSNADLGRILPRKILMLTISDCEQVIIGQPLPELQQLYLASSHVLEFAICPKLQDLFVNNCRITFMKLVAHTIVMRNMNVKLHQDYFEFKVLKMYGCTTIDKDGQTSHVEKMTLFNEIQS